MPFGTAVAAPSAAAPAPSVRPVSASTALRSRLARPAPAHVLAAFPAAVYVAVGDDVLALVASDGLRLPNALVLPAATSSAPFVPHAPGQAGEVTGAGVRVGPVLYRPVRWWAPRAVLPPGPPPVVDAATVAVLERDLTGAARPHLPGVEAGLAAGGLRLRAALVRADADEAQAAAHALVGLGPGLTPSGDDLLAGALVTCAQLRGTPGGEGVAATAAELGRRTAADAASRTSAVSAALLRDAAQGRAAAPVLGLVDALVGRRPLGPALTALLAVGHSSGADTARGVLLAAQALVDRQALLAAQAPAGRPAPPAPRQEHR